MFDNEELKYLEEMKAQLMNGIKKSEERAVEQAARNTQVIIENTIMTQFKLLAEGQQTILETLAPKSKTEELEEELDFLKAVVRAQSQRIDALEKRLA